MTQLHSFSAVSLTRCVLAIACILSAVNVPAQEQLDGNYYAHDPSTIIKDGANYYFFRTDQNISINRSPDLRNWSHIGSVFSSGWPSWTTNAVPGMGGFWAPDIAYFNGKYHLYYSISHWGTIDSAIGLVTTPSLNSPTWTDQGKVIQSDAVWEAGPDTDLTSFNCIDPNILMDTNGTVWMAFGSYSDGILVMQLDPATGKRIATNSPITKIADSGTTFFSNGTEGSCVYQHDGYYYLFLNYGGCCSGIDSTYNIRVGRSASVTGPYLDKSGSNLLDGGGTILFESTGRFIGPGHAGIFNENGTYWFSYHYYDGNENGNAKLGLGRLEWAADGWPALTNDWSALYTFDVDAREHRLLYNGALKNGAAITNDSELGRVLSLTATNHYVTLSNSVANAKTFAAWVKWNGGSDWQRVFDFGAGTNQYLFLTPRAYNGKMRFAITISGNGAEQIIDAPTAMPTDSWCHVAVTLDGTKGLLYLNGNPVGTNSSLTIRPWQTLARSNYLGKSQWPDPTFSGKIDSFRIFGRALSAGEVRDVAWAPPSLAHRYSFASNAWDSVGMAHGRLMGNATVTNGALTLTGTSGDYVNLPGGLVSGCGAVSVEFWATFGASGSWARVFDFGTYSGASGQNYLYFCPNTGSSGHRLEMATNTMVTFDIAGTLNNRSVQVVCVVDPATGFGAVYTNGVLEKAVTNSWPALGSISSAWSYLGRSLWSSDPWLNATIDEFRIYDGRLTAEEIAMNYAAGPDTLYQDVWLTMANASGGYTFNWPSYAPGFALESSGWLGTGAIWNPVNGTPVISNGCCWLTAAVTDTNAFFRLRR